MVKVPKDPKRFCHYKISMQRIYIFWNGFLQEAIDLPPGQWEIVGVVSEIPGEVADSIAEGSEKNFGYKDYENKQSSHFYSEKSLKSLARSHGFEPDQAILLKQLNHG